MVTLPSRLVCRPRFWKLHPARHPQWLQSPVGLDGIVFHLGSSGGLEATGFGPPGALHACATASCRQRSRLCALLCTCGPEGDNLAPPGAVNALLQGLGLQTRPHEDHVDLSSLRLADQASHILSGPLTPLQDLQTNGCCEMCCIADRGAVQASAALAGDTA